MPLLLPSVFARREPSEFPERPRKRAGFAKADIGHLLDCELVISMLPDDAAVCEVVFGRSDGLEAGLMPRAIICR
jgi:3-hydroxyisobutyrate dehydrogenase-like beta-hydroxyacid dehydrogenase